MRPADTGSTLGLMRTSGTWHEFRGDGQDGQSPLPNIGKGSTLHSNQSYNGNLQNSKTVGYSRTGKD